MKTPSSLKKMSLILCVLLANNLAMAQTIITIDNNFDSKTFYKTFQEAHDAAMPGDIIYVQPSPISYGNATIEKALTIVGRSHSETNNISRFDWVRINSSNTTFKGVSMMSLEVGSSVEKAITNVNIYECKPGGLHLGQTSGYDNPLNGFVARGCVIGDIVQHSAAKNILISNNIIQGQLVTHAPSTLIVSNNIFRFSDSFSFSNHVTEETALLFNNMFISNHEGSATIRFSGGPWNISNCLLYNYDDTYDVKFVAVGHGSFLENNTLFNVNPLFTDVNKTVDFSLAGKTKLIYPYNPSERPEDNLTLQAGSPARTGGIDGSEIGLYNNNFQYSTIGNPRGVPTIDVVSYDGTVPKNGTINVIINAKSH